MHLEGVIIIEEVPHEGSIHALSQEVFCKYFLQVMTSQAASLLTQAIFTFQKPLMKNLIPFNLTEKQPRLFQEVDTRPLVTRGLRPDRASLTARGQRT